MRFLAVAVSSLLAAAGTVEFMADNPNWKAGLIMLFWALLFGHTAWRGYAPGIFGRDWRAP